MELLTNKITVYHRPFSQMVEFKIKRQTNIKFIFHIDDKEGCLTTIITLATAFIATNRTYTHKQKGG